MDILIVDDEKSIRDSTTVAVEIEGHYAETADSGLITELKLKEENFDLVFLDLRLGDEDGLEVLKKIVKGYPNIPVVMFTAHASVRTAVEAMRLGAFDYLEKPFTPDQVRAVLARGEKAARMRKQIKSLESEVQELKSEVSSQAPAPTFESEDAGMQGVLDVLFRAADSQASILVLGESGTGKSVVAKAVHQRSHLAAKPFVTISCPSLSKELLESELFGHVKGAFTGAVSDKWGKVHAANGGTLFLDEIGELPMEIQPKLLRLLQEREYERLGENKTRSAEVRVIAATNRDLKREVEEGNFREDLYYRLNVISVELPPLRARSSDLIAFAEDYLDFFAGKNRRKIRGFSREALARVTSYDWPGNLRELRNVIERAVILCRGEEISPDDLGPSGGAQGAAPGAAGDGGGAELGGDYSLEELESEHIKRVLSRAGSIQEAASTLGIDQATLYRKRKKLGLC